MRNWGIHNCYEWIRVSTTPPSSTLSLYQKIWKWILFSISYRSKQTECGNMVHHPLIAILMKRARIDSGRLKRKTWKSSVNHYNEYLRQPELNKSFKLYFTFVSFWNVFLSPLAVAIARHPAESTQPFCPSDFCHFFLFVLNFSVVLISIVIQSFFF